MQALLDALQLKFTDSALYNQVGGRIYFEVSEVQDVPRVVYHVITSTPDDTYTESYDDVLVQVDLFSAKSAGSMEINTMYSNLKALFSTAIPAPVSKTMEGCSLTLTGSGTVLWMRRTNLIPSSEDLDTPLPDGTMGIYHWCVDYEVVLDNG